VTARELLDRGAERIGRELHGQPEVRATLQETLGRVYGNLGAYERAADHLRAALGVRREVLGDRHPDVAATLHALADVLQEQASYEQAEALYREALEIRRAAFGREHPAVAASLNDLADSLHDQGDYEPPSRSTARPWPCAAGSSSRRTPTWPRA
jgi:tetratricopeptide (TPR) repeat protein